MTDNLFQKNTVLGLVLAAGKGKRMQSDLPKVLHEVLGKPMLGWILDTLNQVGIEKACVILSPGQDQIHSFLQNRPAVSICEQQEARGTGDAVASCFPIVADIVPPSYARARKISGNPDKFKSILICVGDVPALQAKTIETFIKFSIDQGTALSVIAATYKDPTGLGRIVLDSKGFLDRIVEEKDTSLAEKTITLCNTGIIFAKTSLLFDLLQNVAPNNQQKEYYLTDCFKIARERGIPTSVYVAPDETEFLGVNDQQQLKLVEQVMAQKQKG